MQGWIKLHRKILHSEIFENDYDTINEINKLMDKYGIEDAAFFDLEKWKAMGPEQIRELESYFQYLLRRSKEIENKNKE